jgi:hypothetical protein
MEYLYPVLGGVLNKIYDDLDDNNLLKNDIFRESLKGSEWILLTLLSHSDFNFTAMLYAVNITNYLVKSDCYEGSYETSLLLLYPIFFLISFHTMQALNMYDIVFLIGYLFTFAIEPILIKKEYSATKLILRATVLVFTLITIPYYSYFNISPSIVKMVYYSVGYLLVSVCFQAYFLFAHEPKIETNKEPLLHKTQEGKEEKV